MAYDAPDYTAVFWDATGPYWKTASGKKTYISPAVADQYQDDPKLLAWAKSKGFSIDYSDPNNPQVTSTGAPSASFGHTAGTWNSGTGQFDQSINWGNIAALGIGAAIAAPFVAAAFGAGAGGAAPLASTPGATGIGAIVPGVAPSGGVAAALTPTAVEGATAAAAGGAGAAGAAGATAPTVGALMAAPEIAPGAATAAGGVGLGETGATTGLAGSGFGTGGGLGIAATPTVGDLATVGSSVPGIADAASIPAASASAVPGILKNVIPAASGIVGNILQKNAVGNAVDAQTAAAANALAAEQAGGERAIGILSPWTNLGSAAASRLGDLMHLVPTAPPGGTPGNMTPPTPAMSTGTAATPPPTTSTTPPAQGAPTAIMRGPDGSLRQVPADHVSQLESAGARRVA